MGMETNQQHNITSTSTRSTTATSAAGGGGMAGNYMNGMAGIYGSGMSQQQGRQTLNHWSSDLGLALLVHCTKDTPPNLTSSQP